MFAKLVTGGWASRNPSGSCGATSDVAKTRFDIWRGLFSVAIHMFVNVRMGASLSVMTW
jgi:hypothetical protein